ncbi:putative disease resistance RPP13-like protein 1 [Zingiber officinale]|uniref:putative disease resistance RPP13-like protein 1 n=1 Tax=Zingiber officinale TaxID=94328 RepID=UPI001C4AF28C|nr:putative disease resistance RPP13-like protein 1 [Zingiber officinale]
MDWITVLQHLGLPELVKKVVEFLLTKACSEVSRIQGVEDEIAKLRRTHERIQSLLVDAEERRHIEDESVKSWLRELKTVGFDADDLLDGFRTHVDVFKHAKEAPSRKRKRSWYDVPIPSLGVDTRLVRRYNIATEIVKIQSRLDEIYKRRKNLQLKPSDGRQRNEGSNMAVFFPAVASLDVSKVVGRSKQCDSIVAALKVDSDLPPRVIAIYGIAGIGKTTLAQLVFNHFSGRDREEVSPNPSGSLSGVDRHFEMKIWVSLPKVCDIARATKEIIEGITGEICKLPSLNHLQDCLKKCVKDKKFLLVLDNFWAEDFKFWEILRLPLLKGAKGSSVLITTQNKEVSRLVATMPLHLEGLEMNDCLKLFTALAFPQAEEDVDQLKDIGERIVERCQGSPLATISLGKLLRSESNVDNWEIVLNEMLALEGSANSSTRPILPSLMISYHHLNYQLKQCFTYCSIFPDNFEFDKDQLVRMWIAEGLIQQNGRRPPEAIGSRLFDYLLWMSFFERSTKPCSNGTICKYTMPNLIHDLARLLSNNELLVMEDNELNPSSGQFRYASLLHRKCVPIMFEKIYNQEHLRALKLCNESKIDVAGIPKDLFGKLKYLRLLDLSNSGIEKLPDSVGKLVHLRYLGLSETNVEELPESVEDLYNLQTLELNFCSNLSSLPEGTSKLVNLRHLGLHLDWEQINDLRRMPTGIDRLTSLMTLSRFTVTNYVDGCNLRELKNLDLRGELCICKLENVTNASDASEANLGEKRIDKLMLRWSGETSNVQQGANTSNVQQGVNICKEVAERLQPYKYLKCLWILNYPGSKFPDWLENIGFSSLEMVRLSCSGECESLPSLGQLPKLKHLYIEGMKRLVNLKNMIKGFLSLETLTIKDMPILNMLCKFKGNFPKLSKVVVCQCPKLRRPKDLPRRIELIIIPQSTDNVDGNDVSSDLSHSA